MLAQNPDVQIIAQEHADKMGNMFGYQEIVNSEDGQYFKWLMRETLRLYPVAVGIPRKCLEDITVGHYHIPKNVCVHTHYLYKYL